VSKADTGPEYDSAIQAGAIYWQLVLAGKDTAAAKQASDAALSRLLGCSARVNGRKLRLREQILRALHDSLTSSRPG
jgi:hypothetical protein